MAQEVAGAGPAGGGGGLLCSVGRRKKEAGWAGRAKRPDGCWAKNLKENSFRNKNWIF
jgi:hypothetical protein